MAEIPTKLKNNKKKLFIKKTNEDSDIDDSSSVDNDTATETNKKELKTELKTELKIEDPKEEDSDDNIDEEIEEEKVDEEKVDEEEISDEEKEEEKEDEKEIENIEEDEEPACGYQNIKKNRNIDDEEPIDDIDIYKIEKKKVNIFVDKNKRITKPFMTRYEYVRLLQERTTQLMNGAKPMIKNTETIEDEKEVVKLEIKNGTIPLFIIRPLPDNTREKWEIKEFTNIADFIN